MKPFWIVVFLIIPSAGLALDDTLDKIASQTPQTKWLTGLSPLSDNYSLSILKESKPTEDWLIKLKERQIQILESRTIGSDSFWATFSLGTGFEYLNSHPVPLIEVAAVANPLIAQNNGLFTDGGGHGYFSARMVAQLSPYFSVRATPYLKLSSRDNSFEDQVSFYLGEAMASIELNHFVLEGGRDTTHWGNGRLGHLLFSGDHEPLNMVRVKSSEPVIGPWFLKYLGPSQFEAFIAALDKNQTFPHTRLTGMYFTFLPHPRFEFGLGQSILFGGDGSPTDNPFVIFSEKVTDAPNPADRNFLLSARWRIPGIEIEPYAELMWEDCCGSPPINSRDTLDLIGVYFPRLDPQGKLDFTFETVRTNHITYRHDSFASGYVYRNRILGHPLGPDAMGIYTQFRYFYSNQLQGKLSFSFELRGREARALSGEDVTTVFPSFQNDEQRHQIKFDLNYQPTLHLLLAPQIGIEHVSHVNYQRGPQQWNGLFGFQLSYLL